MNKTKKSVPIKRKNCSSSGERIEYVFPQQLHGIRLDEDVLVDSSALCAALYELNASDLRASDLVLYKSLCSRLFSEDASSQSAILFGQFVQMRFDEVVIVFRSREEVPVGVIKRKKSVCVKHSGRMK